MIPFWVWVLVAFTAVVLVESAICCLLHRSTMLYKLIAMAGGAAQSSQSGAEMRSHLDGGDKQHANARGSARRGPPQPAASRRYVPFHVSPQLASASVARRRGTGSSDSIASSAESSHEGGSTPRPTRVEL